MLTLALVPRPPDRCRGPGGKVSVKVERPQHREDARANLRELIERTGSVADYPAPAGPRVGDLVFWVEPPIGIEPMTYSLRVNRSAD
jgi:hypothetical protein